MFNVSALLLDDALKPATPLTNGANFFGATLYLSDTTVVVLEIMLTMTGDVEPLDSDIDDDDSCYCVVGLRMALYG